MLDVCHPLGRLTPRGHREQFCMEHARVCAYTHTPLTLQHLVRAQANHVQPDDLFLRPLEERSEGSRIRVRGLVG